jgi:hypothetical protein
VLQKESSKKEAKMSEKTLNTMGRFTSSVLRAYGQSEEVRDLIVSCSELYKEGYSYNEIGEFAKDFFEHPKKSDGSPLDLTFPQITDYGRSIIKIARTLRLIPSDCKRQNRFGKQDRVLSHNSQSKPTYRDRKTLQGWMVTTYQIVDSEGHYMVKQFFDTYAERVNNSQINYVEFGEKLRYFISEICEKIDSFPKDLEIRDYRTTSHNIIKVLGLWRRRMSLKKRKTNPTVTSQRPVDKVIDVDYTVIQPVQPTPPVTSTTDKLKQAVLMAKEIGAKGVTINPDGSISINY